MAKWELYRESPNPGGIATSSSETFDYNFPENGTSSDFVYRIVYNGDDGCTGSTKVTVKSGDCNCPCNCDNLTFPNGTTVELGPEEGATATCAYSFTGCNKSYESAINVVSTPAWLDARVDRGSILLTTVTNTQSERTGTVTLSVCNDKCTSKAISVKQNRAEACEESWSLSFQGTKPDYYGHGTDGGGTPVTFNISHNGEPYEIVNNSDMIVNFGPNGSLNDYIVTNNFVRLSAGMYNLFTYIDETKLCNIIGQRIECSLAPKSCPDAKLEFTIIVANPIKVEVVVNGLPSSLGSMEIAFSAHVGGRCDIDVTMGYYTYYADASISPVRNKFDIISGFDSGTLKVKGVANTGGLNDDPAYWIIDSFTGTKIVVKYTGPYPNTR